MFYGDFSGDRGARFQAALETLQEMFGRVWAQDNLIGLQRSAGFQRDPRFRAAVDAFAGTDQERSLGWRLHTLTWAAEQTLHVPGAFVECGVWHGFSMAVVCAYLDFGKTGREMFLYDTFRGIPEAYNSEDRSTTVYDQEIAEDPDAVLKGVRDRFARWPDVHVIPGTVPDTFADAIPEQIAFLHLDMNAAASEIAALEHLFDRVSPGGMIVFDDYGWSGYRAQKEAEDAFMTARGHSILELPTGQGLVVKHALPAS